MLTQAMLTQSVSGNLISYEYVPVGKDPSSPRAGDLLFCHRPGFVSKAIRFGEALRFRGGDRWSHVACFAGPKSVLLAGETPVTRGERLVEALTRGVTESQPQEYRFVECVHVRTNMEIDDCVQATKFLNACIGVKYGFLVDAAIGLRFVTPFDRLTFGTSGTMVCSGLAAQMLCRGSFVFRTDPAYISPAQLAVDLGVPPTLGQAREELTK